MSALKSNGGGGGGGAMQTQEPTSHNDSPVIAKSMHETLFLTNSIHNIVFRRYGDPNVLPYVHCSLAFVYVSFYPDANDLVSPEFPWKLLSVSLNTLLSSFGDYDAIEKGDFPDSKDFKQPLPEDYAIRGLL